MTDNWLDPNVLTDEERAQLEHLVDDDEGSLQMLTSYGRQALRKVLNALHQQEELLPKGMKLTTLSASSPKQPSTDNYDPSLHREIL